MERQALLEQQYLVWATQLDLMLQKFPRLRYAILHHRNLRGEPMEFFDKPYLIEIYTDPAPEIALMSSVQTGKSEWLIVNAHMHAENGLQVLYVLPTTELRNLFVANRVDRLYQVVPHYAAMLEKGTGTASSRGLKHFGPNGGAIFFAGSNSQTTFIEKPIDLVIGDETDRFDQANYEKADDRMTASPYKYKFEASNPTVDNYAIAARYNNSDQRSWFVQCRCCNTWQKLDWFKNVVDQTDDSEYRLRDRTWEEGCGRDIHMMCIRCGRPLERFTHKSQWVPKFPKKMQLHGYHIHQMLSSYVRIDKMWTKFGEALGDDTKMQVFYNSMLGVPFAGKGSKLTDEVLNRCKDKYTMPAHADTCFMGVDVGKKLNVVIRQLVPGEKLRLVFAGTVKDFSDLDYLFARYNIVTYVIDAAPETRLSLEWAKKHTGRGWVCRYHQGLEEIRTNDDDRVVTADRTMIMDRVLSFFSQGRMILPANAQSLDGGNYFEQLKMPTRIYDEEKNRYDWRGDPDHYYHAEVYALLAYLVRGDFRVVGLNPNATMQVVQVPEELDEASIFPPGTPEHLKEHYREIFRRAKSEGGKIE